MSTEDALLATLETVAVATREMQDKTRGFNLLADVDWMLRQQVRTVEGHLAKAEERVESLLWQLDSDDARAVIEKVWGPIVVEDV